MIMKRLGRHIAILPLLIGAPWALASDMPEPLSVFRDCDTCPEMVAMPTGEFVMGATKEEQKHMFIGVVPYEHPAHTVRIDYPFAIGRFEVTTEEFDAYVQETGAAVGGTCGIRLMEKGPLARKVTGTPHPDNNPGLMGPYFMYITDGSERIS